jgi:hypothetical protein
VNPGWTVGPKSWGAPHRLVWASVGMQAMRFTQGNLWPIVSSRMSTR